MEKKDKFKQTLPEGLKRYYTKEAGEWGSIIDSLMSEDKAKLALSLMYGEPLYTQGELDKAREEGYQKGWEDGSKGKVFEKIEVETEVTFKDLRDVIEGKEDAGEFLSKLTTK